MLSTNKPMTLREFAARNPKARVRLFFQKGAGYGELVVTAETALCPNASGRFFPPEGVTAASLGWPVPFWYGSECVSWSAV